MAEEKVSPKILRTMQRHSILGIVSLFLSLCMVAGYALVMDNRRSETIAQLSIALSEQRGQFEDCTAERTVVPASTCKEPIADEPEKIVEESESTPTTIPGARGPAGVMGPTGPAGPSAYQVALANGFQGTEPSWLSSLRGATGFSGDAGESAYQVAVRRGFVGSEGTWLASLRADDGATGKTGADGAKGDKGDPGVQGIQGDKGDKGDPGSPGDKGDKGDPGERGSQGEKGERGEKGQDGASYPPPTMHDVCISGYSPKEMNILGTNVYVCAAG